MKNNKNIIAKVLFALVSIFAVNLLSAQSAGSLDEGITAATDTIAGSFDAIETLIFAIAAVLALVGAIRVYSKFQSGDPDTMKSAMGWFGAAIFLIVASFAIRAFFGL